ncbi:MAG: polysaccharide export protein [Verrucomicrobiales bacterium]|nr:polysaccharide export protein [Verrucomicrobiales bacterium]
MVLPLLITACGGGGGIRPDGTTSGVPVGTEGADENPDRPIAGEDTLTIKIVGEGTDATAYPVSPAGYIQFPYLDLVRVEGLTPSEIKNLIENRLIKEGYFVQPQLLVTAAYQERYAHVLGAVGRPGLVPLRGEKKLDILDVISYAGGTTRLARDKVEYTHDGVTESLSLDKLKRAGPDSRIYVQPGDVIEVKETLF